ncbi:hypothetical protein P168DRAFT_343960 [Aspergillus campestris IBT 28561]|uniref:Dynamin family protein n=1 Tax=Aspergillus campestris (strain IBT 28561) TaxID=1392248 RepID=A0A2I1D3H7_ASPC2|nr:uncharacterized protein P168DRAFT_343960 [Aspergillus campestris IBT 28561]PKY04430.1 hypothetical protein P168DRAFT_343960 [Aspergillus campestris IBT 28561]
MWNEALPLAGPSDGVSNGHLATAALGSLETHEQRRVLDIVSQLRKCGLESVLSLPQLVVCGDQSAGKSSVLEALTEIPFPRKDNLFTRYPTEINIRPAPINSLQIKVIPDPQRSDEEQAAIRNFRQTITDFGHLPRVMERATQLMGIDRGPDTSQTRRAFARDVLSVEIEGPNRPQLTVVDLPGIIQAETKDASQIDVDMTVEITESYISQPRTICLAVVSATNDYANQPILNKVRHFDPKGERTLGIITKPDRLPPGSDTEKQFVQLAKNEDIFFTLGWHVLKNRTFEEAQFSIEERNASEAAFFRKEKSLFGKLPVEQVGIEGLVSRLSRLLFTHVQKELPRLQEDLEVALRETAQEIDTMGISRATPQECRTFLSQLAMNFYEVCKAAVNGHYEGNYFQSNVNSFSVKRPETIRRLRAAIQFMNQSFAQEMRKNAHKYQIRGLGADAPIPKDTALNESKTNGVDGEMQPLDECTSDEDYNPFRDISRPQNMSHQKAIDWVRKVVTRARGRELSGNFNPLVISELFWEQSSKWRLFAQAHVEQVSNVCHCFLKSLLREKAPRDTLSCMWPLIVDEMKARQRRAMEELDKILTDTTSCVINYNHYYTDTIQKSQFERRKGALRDCISRATSVVRPTNMSNKNTTSIDVDKALNMYHEHIDPNMDTHSSEEVLDCVIAIYKVYQKQFVANVTVQVIERHILRDLEHVLSPLTLSRLSDSETLALACEPGTAKRRREFLQGRLAKLNEGHKILQEIVTAV